MMLNFDERCLSSPGVFVPIIHFICFIRMLYRGIFKNRSIGIRLTLVPISASAPI